MPNRTDIAQLWTAGLSAPDAEHVEAVAAVLDPDVVSVNPLRTIEGRSDVLAAFGKSVLAPAFATGVWSAPRVRRGVVTSTCAFADTSVAASATVRVTVTEDGVIKRVVTTFEQAPPTPTLPSDPVLRWAADAVGGTSVVATESLARGGHRASGTFRLRIEGPSARATDVILKVPVPGWISTGMVITNARALQLAGTQGLPAPRLIAADLDGSACGTVASLETFLSGSADLPPTVSVARLQEAGAALARINALEMEPQADVPLRVLPHWDDYAAERRRGLLPTTPLLQEADERVQSHGVPAAASVFLHGDVWAGNMLWEGDRCVALIDWKTAGVGHPAVDLSGLRAQVAVQYGPDAPAHVLEGWQRQAGREASAVPYWDVVAALNTPTVTPDGPGFADDGSPLDAEALTERRDAFLLDALEQLPARVD